jgi:universal stress protein A
MALQYKNILCPIDFDENSMEALRTAASLARQSGATLHVVHVIPIVLQPADIPIYVDIYSAPERVARQKLQEISVQYLSDLKYDLKLMLGEPAASIIEQHRRLHADLIVMSTHGRRGLAHLFLGSVAERVVREAECPVLTTRPVHTEAAHVAHS